MEKQDYLMAASITARCMGVAALVCWSIDSGWIWQALLVVCALIVAYHEAYVIMHNR